MTGTQRVNTRSSEENTQKYFWHEKFVNQCKNVILSYCHLKAYGCITLPWLLPVHLSPGMFFCLDFCTRQSCQESSCCPQLFSSFDPTSSLFLPWSLNFFHFGQLLSFAALLWAGEKFCQRKQEK